MSYIISKACKFALGIQYHQMSNLANRQVFRNLHDSSIFSCLKKKIQISTQCAISHENKHHVATKWVYVCLYIRPLDLCMIYSTLWFKLAFHLLKFSHAKVRVILSCIKKKKKLNIVYIVEPILFVCLGIAYSVSFLAYANLICCHLDWFNIFTQFCLAIFPCSKGVSAEISATLVFTAAAQGATIGLCQLCAFFFPPTPILLKPYLAVK